MQTQRQRQRQTQRQRQGERQRLVQSKDHFFASGSVRADSGPNNQNKDSQLPFVHFFPISNHIIFSFSTSRHENGKNIREIRRSRDYFRFLNLFIDEVADYLITVDNIDFNWDMGDVEC